MKLWSLVLSLAILFFTGTLQAATLSFFCITGNTAGDCAIGESQLSAEVIDLDRQVQFNFYNTGTEESVISEIYFDDTGLLFGLTGLIDADDGINGNPGVDFSQGATPPDLPGGDNITPAFEVSPGLLAGADSPSPVNGVGPDEWLGIIFNLQNGRTFDDIIAGLTDGGLRIGLHVIAFDSGGSESFVNNSPVPLPAGVWLLLSVLPCMLLFRQK